MKTKSEPTLRSQLIDCWARNVKRYSNSFEDDTGFKAHVEGCMPMLRSPLYHSFILPANGRVLDFDAEIKLGFEDLNLPFDKCIFEYKITPDYYIENRVYNSKPVSAVVIVEKTEDTLRMLPIWEVPYDQGGGTYWTPNKLGAILYPEAIIETRKDNKILVSGKVGVFTASEYVRKEMEREFADIGSQYSTFSDELRTVIHFASVCGCDNVKPVKIFTPSKESVSTALIRGKARPYDKWVLDIYLNSTEESTGTGLGGSHASPRLHIRRGHIRRYQTGKTTWVKQCMVGTPELGVIEKDYRVVA